MSFSLSSLRGIVRTCQMGGVIEQILRTQGAEIGKTVTSSVRKSSKLYKKMPWLFENVEKPVIQYGYNNSGKSSYFLRVLDGESAVRNISYSRSGNVYNTQITGPKEHLNCVFDSSKPLFNLSQSAISANSGAKGTPPEMVDFLINLNNSAFRAEGRIARSRLSGLERFLPTEGRLRLSSGVEGTPTGRTDLGLNYHGTDFNLELQNPHVQKVARKVKGLLSSSSG